MNKLEKFTIISDVILFDKALSPLEKVVMILICKYDEQFRKKNGPNYSYSNTKLKDDAGIVSNETYEETIKRLKELGYIADKRKKRHYEVNWKKLGVIDVEEDETDIYNPEQVSELDGLKNEEVTQSDSEPVMLEEPVGLLDEIPDDEWDIFYGLCYENGQLKERSRSAKSINDYVTVHQEKGRKFPVYFNMLYEKKVV